MLSRLSLLGDLSRTLQSRMATLVTATLLWRWLVGLILLPLLLVMFQWLLRWSGRTVVSDADLVGFLLSPYGASVALFMAALYLGFGLAGHALVLMVLAAPPGPARQTTASALRALGARAHELAHLALRIVLRAVWIAAPFLLIAWLVARWQLAAYDINYYLAERPLAFWITAGVGGVSLFFAGCSLAAQCSAWALALPLFLFEGRSARAALAESQEHTHGSRKRIFAEFAGSLLALVVMRGIASALWLAVGRSALNWCGTSMESLAFGAALWLLGAALIDWMLGALGYACFATLQLRWYCVFRAGREPAVTLPLARRVTVKWLPLGLVIATLIAFLASAISLLSTQPVTRCEIIAHRGASAVAPENTLASIRAAIEAGADAVEIDVQETKDGMVIVLHDRDLARVGGGSPLAVAQSTAEELRVVDIGSSFSPRFASERVALLDEVLQLAKDRIHVLIELKRYGPGGQLPERVVECVERAGMTAQIACMSLVPELVERLRILRPQWRVGSLSAVSIGELDLFDSTFVAIRASRASHRFVQRAHGRGKQVYLWTVNDPLAITRALALGVDGIITDHPELAVDLRGERGDLDGIQRALAQLAGYLGAAWAPEESQ